MTRTLKCEIGKVRLDDFGKRTSELIGRISGGEKVEVSFEGNKMIVEGENCLTLGCGYGSRITIKTRASRYPKYFGGRIPSQKTIEKWDWNGYCKTVTGLKVEPDGRGPDGSPSWMIALGYL